MNRTATALLVSILVAGALARSVAITRSWAPRDHNGWGGAFYSNIARNYLRVDERESGFAPIVNRGDSRPEKRVYYLTHPPLLGLSLSTAFQILGEHEWVARLVPLAFSLGAIFLVYCVAAEVRDRETGLLAALLASAFPMDVFYGAHVDVQGPPVTFFSLLLLLAYLRDRIWLLYMSLILGAGFDWPVHYMAGLVAAHALVTSGFARKWVLALPVVSVVISVFFFVYARHIAPRPEQRYLGADAADAFSFWTGLRLDAVEGYSSVRPSLIEWVDRVMGYHVDLFTLPVLLVAGLGLGIAAWQRSGMALLLALWGSLHVALFPMGAFAHDYWSRYLTPGLALAAAIALVAARDRISTVIPARRRRPIGTVAAGVLVGYAATMTIDGVALIEASREEEALLGKKLGHMTRPGEGVLSYLAMDIRDAYYAGCRIEDEIDRLSLLDAALKDPDANYRYFVVPRRIFDEDSGRPLFQRLAAHPRIRFRGRIYGRWRWRFYIFDLSSSAQSP